MRRTRRIVLSLLGAVALVAASATGATAHTDRTASPPRPGAAPGASAPLGGVVPGRTGAAARVGMGPAIDRFRAARREMRDGVRPAAQLHNWWGIFPPSTAGMVSTHSVFTSTSVGGGDFVYAPTMKPPNGSCIEIVTADSGSGPQLWAWDWCNGVNVGKSTTINASFVSTYTTTVNGLPAYTVDEVQTNIATNTWTAYLYNYTTGAWDSFYVSAGTDQSGLSFGWDMFEVYTTVNTTTGHGYFCSALTGKQFDSSNIRLYIAGAWVAATASNAPLSGAVPAGSAFDCPALTFSLVTADNHWHVHD